MAFVAFGGKTMKQHDEESVKITTGLCACEKSMLFLIPRSFVLLSEGLFCYFSERADVCFVLPPTATSFFASFFAEKKEG